MLAQYKPISKYRMQGGNQMLSLLSNLILEHRLGCLDVAAKTYGGYFLN